MNKTERQLVNRISEGDFEAFRELHDSHKRGLIGVCWRFLGNDSEVEAVVEEIYIKALKNMHRFHFEPSLSTWLDGITVHLSRGYLKKKKTLFSSADSESEHSVVSELMVEQISFRLDQKLEYIWVKYKPLTILRFYRPMIGLSLSLGFFCLFIFLIDVFWPKLLVILPQIDLAAYH